MILKLLEKYKGLSFTSGVKDVIQGPENRLRVVWGAVLPQDVVRQVNSEQILVQTGIHSRRRAMDDLGIKDPQLEFDRWLEERATILKMNKELGARSTRGGERERALSFPKKDVQSQEGSVEE